MQALSQASRRLLHSKVITYRKPAHTSAVKTMSFLSSKQEQLCGRARQFIQTWGSAKDKSIDDVKQELKDLVADDCVFKADGVLYTSDLKGSTEIMNALEREHKKYEHVSYRPVAVAADEDTNTAFVGVAWEYKNIGSISGTDKATNNTSRGFSIKQLKFDQQGQKLIESRVNRQMTPEEQKMLLRPGVKCQPADVFGDVLPKLGWGTAEEVEKDSDGSNSSDFAHTMQNNLLTWVHCWNTDADLSQLDRVLDPEMLAFDAYGLHQAADKPDRDGHAISMMGREDAKGAIAGLQKKFTDRNKLISYAVNPDKRVAFDYWHGEAKGRDSDVKFEVEGVDMILFNKQGQITTLVQFNMQDYSKQLQGAAPAPAGAPA